MVYTMLSALDQQEIIIRVSRTEVAFFNSQKEVKKKWLCSPLLPLFPLSLLWKEEGGKRRRR